jgi:hypothetical protein
VLLVDDRDEDVAIAIAVVERIATHKVPVPSSRFEADPNIVEANGSCPRFGQTTWYGHKTGPVCRGQHGFGPLTSADQPRFTPILAPATRISDDTRVRHPRSGRIWSYARRAVGAQRPENACRKPARCSTSVSPQRERRNRALTRRLLLRGSARRYGRCRYAEAMFRSMTTGRSARAWVGSLPAA